MPSIAWRFHPAIRFGWTPCLQARSETVKSPRIASRATFALNSAVNRLRVVIVDRPFHVSIHLSHLSMIRGPALFNRGHPLSPGWSLPLFLSREFPTPPAPPASHSQTNVG